MAGSLNEVREELASKREQMHRIFDEAGPDLDLGKVTTIKGDTDAKAAEIQRREKELKELNDEFNRLNMLALIGKNNDLQKSALDEPARGMQFGSSSESSGEPRVFTAQHLKRMLHENKGYRAFRDNQMRQVTMDVPADGFKTLITLSGVNNQPTRQGLVNMALEERTVSDLMLQGQTDNNTIEYYEETSVTNNATTVAEGGTKPESALAWTLRTENVRKIATWIPATKESLDDVSWLESQIRGRLQLYGHAY